MSAPDPEAPETPRDLPGIAAFAALGTTMAFTVAVFVVLGIWADSAFRTSPICLVIGIVLGCAAATASTVVLARRYL